MIRYIIEAYQQCERLNFMLKLSIQIYWLSILAAGAIDPQPF